MTEPQIILVDKQDHEQGSIGKLAAHQQGLLHRAYSIFIIRKTQTGYETLLQKRAQGKYHSGGLWTNSCCSHPSPGGELLTQARQRLFEEFGLDVALVDVGQFIYRADLDNQLIEHELDHVLVGMDPGTPPKPNPEEIMDWRWCRLDTLAIELETHANHYTAWISSALAWVQRYVEHI